MFIDQKLIIRISYLNSLVLIKMYCSSNFHDLIN